MTISRSNRIPSSVPLTVQRRHPLYISSTDPRNNSKFILQYPGEVVVLSPADYIKYITAGSVIPYSDDSNLDNSNPGQTVSTLHPPTNLYWNPTDPNALSVETSSSGSTPLLDITITFDPSVDDITTDGAITYEFVATPSAASTVQNSAATGGTTSTNSSNTSITSTSTLTPISSSTISTVIKTSSQIQLKWKAVSGNGMTNYEVTVTGANLPGASGQTKKVYYSGSDQSGGYHFFSLTPTSGVFHGAYNFSIAVQYGSNGLSKGVTYNGHVTI